jgi:cob(I)alamin adenosyltransferase
MKSGNSGEVVIFDKLADIRYWCPGKHPFIMSQGPDPVHYKHAAKALEYAFAAVEKGTHLLICDEILDTVIFGVLEKDQILSLMERCKNKVELVQIKHAYYAGARARKGIEY